MKYLKILMLPLLGLPFFTACEDDDPAFDATADVFVMARATEEGGAEFAPAYYVYSNLGMKSVSVTPSDGSDAKEMERYRGLSTTYALVPEDTDYKMMPPASGTNTFNVVTNNDEQVTLTDALESGVLSPSSTVEAMIEGNNLILEWSLVSNAEAYIVRMLDNDEENLIFGTNFLKEDTDSISLAIFNIGQQSGITPQNGVTYKIEVQAYLFEDNAVAGDGANVQSVSTKIEPFVWETQP